MSAAGSKASRNNCSWTVAFHGKGGEFLARGRRRRKAFPGGAASLITRELDDS